MAEISKGVAQRADANLAGPRVAQTPGRATERARPQARTQAMAAPSDGDATRDGEFENWSKFGGVLGLGRRRTAGARQL